MESEAQKQPFPNDIFISYSRKDIEFARKLEKSLKAYKPPKGLKDVPHRNLFVFRDEEDITGVEYHQSIEKHLKDSAKLIVICSPNARKSDYVNDEIRLFAKLNGTQNIIPVLLSGIPNNEAKPYQENEKAFPEALCEIMKLPLATSYIGFDSQKDKLNKGVFCNSWYTILANSYGISRNEIEQREKKRKVHRLKITMGIVSGVVILAAILSVWALILQKEAIRQHKNALSKKIAQESLNNLDRQYDLALLLSVEANHAAETIEAKDSLLRALLSHHETNITPRRSYLSVETSFGSAFSKDLKTLAWGNEDGTIILWDVSVDSWVTKAREIANRRLTCEEWQQFMGDYRCRPDCPNYPIPED